MSFLAQPCILLRLAQALINMSEHVQSKGLCPNWDSLELWRGGVPLVHNKDDWVKKFLTVVFKLVKGCKSYDRYFSHIFHNFSQCLLDAEVSQICVYFSKICFELLEKNNLSTVLEEISYCTAMSIVTYLIS